MSWCSVERADAQNRSVQGSVWEAWGRSLELVGTFITGLGLLVAWQRASGRLDVVRDGIQLLFARLRVRLGAAPKPIHIEAPFGGAGGLAVATGTGFVDRGFDPTKPTKEQINALVLEVQGQQEHLKALYKETEKLRTDLTKATQTFLTREDFDAAVADELAKFKGNLDVSAFDDLNVALLGLFITFGGILCGFFA